jgi:dTDP-glucose 4,6-dehydratase
MMKSVENPLRRDLDHILKYTRSVWENLRGERIFITGGTGFIGSWLLESLVWADQKYDLGVEAWIITRDPDAFILKVPHLASYSAVNLLTGDVRDFNFPAGEFKYIIHAAAETRSRFIPEQQLTIFDTIIEGTHRTLQFAQQCGAQKFLFTSSGAVYGHQPSELLLIPEEFQGAPDCTDPRSAYGEGKRAAEILCILVSRKAGFEVKIGRCFTFLGAYLPMDEEFAIGNFIRDGLNGGPILVNGDGTAYRSFLYAADMAVWLWTILFRGKPNYPYNVGSEKPISIAQLAQLVADQFEPKPQIQISKSTISGNLPERYIPSTKRAILELGLHQTVDLNIALEKTISLHKNR